MAWTEDKNLEVMPINWTSVEEMFRKGGCELFYQMLFES